MSSPICARWIFLSALARMSARAPSPSITTPNRSRFGGDGGGAGGAAASTAGGGGGAGAGRSSAPIAAAATSCTTDKNRKTRRTAVGRAKLMAFPFAKTRACSRWSAAEDLRHSGPPLHRPAAPTGRRQIRKAFHFPDHTAAPAVPSSSSQASPEDGSYRVGRRAWQLPRQMKQGLRAGRWLLVPDMTETARSRGPGSTHQGTRWVARRRLDD